MLKIVKQIGEKDGFGKLLGQGLLTASKAIGQGSEKYAFM